MTASISETIARIFSARKRRNLRRRRPVFVWDDATLDAGARFLAYDGASLLARVTVDDAFAEVMTSELLDAMHTLDAIESLQAALEDRRPVRFADREK